MFRSFTEQQGSFVLGHRGARYARPENTLSAFDLARLEGAVGSELDVRLSADYVPFVIHDPDLKRVTEGRDTRFVGDLLANELEQVVLSGGERVPRLQTVLDWARTHNQLLNIELKTELAKEDPVAHVVADVLCTHAPASRSCLVSCFHPWLLARFHRALPTVRRAFLVGAEHRKWCKPSLLKRLRCRVVHPEATLLLKHPELMDILGDYDVNTWTVNEPEDAVALARLGARGIISDEPRRIVEALARFSVADTSPAPTMPSSEIPSSTGASSEPPSY